MKECAILGILLFCMVFRFVCLNENGIHEFSAHTPPSTHKPFHWSRVFTGGMSSLTLCMLCTRSQRPWNAGRGNALVIMSATLFCVATLTNLSSFDSMCSRTHRYLRSRCLIPEWCRSFECMLMQFALSSKIGVVP